MATGNSSGQSSGALSCAHVYFCPFVVPPGRYMCTCFSIGTLQEGADGSEHIRVGKLNLVDLAGSERQSKTGSTVC